MYEQWHPLGIVGVISGAIAALSLVAIALIDSQWEFILFYGVIGGMTTSGTGFLVMSAVVPRWFLRRRGRAGAGTDVADHGIEGVDEFLRLLARQEQAARIEARVAHVVDSGEVGVP